MTQRTPAGQNLSALQRNILEHLAMTSADQGIQGKRSDRVRWKPAQFYETGTSRAAVSNSLRRLEERGLIVRRDSEGQRIGKGKQRTAYVGLTNTGVALAMQNLRQRVIRSVQAKVEELDDDFEGLEKVPEEGRYEQLRSLFQESTFQLKIVLSLLDSDSRRVTP